MSNIHTTETWEKNLNNVLYRSDCLTDEQLRDYQFDFLGAAEKVAASQHVAICLHCAAELSELTAFMEMPDPILTPAKLDRKRLGDKLKTWVATLRPMAVDPTAQLQAAFRSDDVPQSQWYEVVDEDTSEDDNAFVTLEWRPDERGRYQLYGQLLNVPNATGDNQSTLALDSATVDLSVQHHRATINEDGAFTVENVDAGTYQITIRHPEGKIVIPAVTVSQTST